MLEDDSSDYHRELNEGGISETGGVGLLGQEEPSTEMSVGQAWNGAACITLNILNIHINMVLH